MKAIEISAPGEVHVVSLADTGIRPGEVLVKICYVGFCGSDLNTFLGKNLLAKSPVIPGHEIGGTVEAWGEEVPDGIFTKGMSVTVNPYTACGTCSSCKKSRPNACRDNQTMGVQRDGAMTEYISVPWQKVIPAQGLTPRECALVEPMSVGFHAVERGAVSDTDTVAVIGCGMIGLGAIVRASMRGATVVALDIDDEKLALAKEMGASYTINSRSEDVHERLQEMTSGEGPDVMIEAVGSAPTYVTAVEEVAFCGRVICIGYSKTEVSFQTGLFVKKELDIRGSRNALPTDFEAVIRYLRRGGCQVDRLVSATIAPEEAKDALKEWASHPGKIFRILVRF